jgi:hypothetical protein
MNMIKITYPGLVAAVIISTISCTKRINGDLPSREKSILEFKVKGQMGMATFERDGDNAQATVYILQRDDYVYSGVEVTGIVVSRYATASVKSGETLNFSNPERKAKVTVTSASGESLDWWIYLKSYDAFYVGTWKVDNVKLHCDQRISDSGSGVWDTQLSGSEFGNATEEYDNRVIITLDEEMSGNDLTGYVTNDAGADGLYSDFRIVTGFYTNDHPLDMNPRLRHLLPPGTARWTLNLTTGKMNITKDNITSTMVFGITEWGSRTFRFPLPDATGEPWTNNEYSNMWRSSTELFYEVTKIN